MTDLNALPGLAFGVELRRLREAAGLTQKGLSDLIPYSDTLVGFVETGYRLPPAALVTACEKLFDARGVLDRLAALARVFGRPTAPLPDLLAAARGLRLADPLLVPGLLQTEDYAYALLQAANTARDEIDHVLATRPCLATLLDRSPSCTPGSSSTRHPSTALSAAPPCSPASSPRCSRSPRPAGW